jgi:hypothetical protein
MLRTGYNPRLDKRLAVWYNGSSQGESIEHMFDVTPPRYTIDRDTGVRPHPSNPGVTLPPYTGGDQQQKETAMDCTTIDIHDFLEAWGDEIHTAGFVINDYGQIVLYTGARINKETGEFEYGNFEKPCDPEAYIPGV